MAKQLMETESSVAANSTTENILTGQRFERMPYNGYITVYSTGSAAGLREEINIGGRSVSGRLVVNTQNRSPVVPDDLRVEQIEGYVGELIQITVSNTTAGALTHRCRVEIEAPYS